MAPKKAPKAVSETCGKWLQFDAVSETQGLAFWKRSYLMWQLPKLNQPIPKRLAFANEVNNGKSLSRYCEWRGFWNENEIFHPIAIMLFWWECHFRENSWSEQCQVGPVSVAFTLIEFLVNCIPLRNRIGSTVPKNVETLKKLRPTATVYHRTQHSVNENLVGNR